MARIELKAVETMTFEVMKGFSYRESLPHATLGSRENCNILSEMIMEYQIKA